MNLTRLNQPSFAGLCLGGRPGAFSRLACSVMTVTCDLDFCARIFAVIAAVFLSLFDGTIARRMRAFLLLSGHKDPPDSKYIEARSIAAYPWGYAVMFRTPLHDYLAATGAGIVSFVNRGIIWSRLATYHTAAATSAEASFTSSGIIRSYVSRLVWWVMLLYSMGSWR